MFAGSAHHVISGDLLRQVLLNYLQASSVGSWPGADGHAQDDILRCYAQACANGEVPDRQELCRRHAELSADGERVLSLTDNTPYILAWGNDEGFDRVFVEQLKNLARPGDLLIAISGSGNSPNVLRAVEWANQHGLTTFGCTGFSGGKLRKLAQKNLHVPLDDMGIVESIHLTAFHWVVDNLHARISL